MTLTIAYTLASGHVNRYGCYADTVAGREIAALNARLYMLVNPGLHAEVRPS